MKLKVGDIVKFKNCEDMDVEAQSGVPDESFPKYGKIAEIRNNGFFYIEDPGYLFNQKSVLRVLGEGKRFNPGDEVLVKATVKKAFNGYLQIEPSVGVSDVVKVLKRITPERFIVKENYYGMYIGVALKLVSNKDTAQVYASRDAAYQEATDMHLNSYDVIPYGD